MADRLEWKLISETEVKKDRWVDLRASSWLLPNGLELAPYYRYFSRNFVVIIARDRDGNYVCVRQFRPGIGEVTTEFPAGAVEPGEDFLTAAKRELLEETGYTAERWTFIGRTAPNATIANNYAHIFFAESCEKKDTQHLDPSECLDISPVNEAVLESMIRAGRFVQAVHVAAYYMVKTAVNQEWTQEK